MNKYLVKQRKKEAPVGDLLFPRFFILREIELLSNLLNDYAVASSSFGCHTFGKTNSNTVKITKDTTREMIVLGI